MASVSISTPVAQRLDGVEFTGTRAGVAQRFMVHREGLEDLEYNVFETPEALLQAFDRHKTHIAEVAARALDAGQGGSGTLVLQSLLL
jgi:hypothetical protein